VRRQQTHGYLGQRENRRKPETFPSCRVGTCDTSNEPARAINVDAIDSNVQYLHHLLHRLARLRYRSQGFGKQKLRTRARSDTKVPDKAPGVTRAREPEAPNWIDVGEQHCILIHPRSPSRTWSAYTANPIIVPSPPASVHGLGPLVGRSLSAGLSQLSSLPWRSSIRGTKLGRPMRSTHRRASSRQSSAWRRSRFGPRRISMRASSQ
jgi:hypothetical protein